MSANIIVNKQLTGNLCLSVTNHDASLVLNVTGDYNAYLVEVLISRATCMPNDELSSISIPNLHQEVSRILHKWYQNFPPTFLLIDIYPQSTTTIHSHSCFWPPCGSMTICEAVTPWCRGRLQLAVRRMCCPPPARTVRPPSPRLPLVLRTPCQW